MDSCIKHCQAYKRLSKRSCFVPWTSGEVPQRSYLVHGTCIKYYSEWPLFGLMSAFRSSISWRTCLNQGSSTASVWVLAFPGSSVHGSGLASATARRRIASSYYRSATMRVRVISRWALLVSSHEVSAESRKRFGKSPTCRNLFRWAFENAEVTGSGETFSTSDDTFSVWQPSASPGTVQPAKRWFRSRIPL